MAAYARNDLEAEFCRLYIAGLYQTGGKELTYVEVWQLVNARFRKFARKAARAQGKTAAESTAIAAKAKLSIQTVRRDMRIVMDRVRHASTATAASYLDGQMDEVRQDIEATHLIDEAIAARLENLKEDEAGAISAAALYGRLHGSIRWRMLLRDKLLALRFGRQFVGDAEQETSHRTMAQAVLKLDDPEQARVAVMQLLRRELQVMHSSASMPGGGELARLEQMRVQALSRRIGSLRDYLRLLDGKQNGEGHKTFELAFYAVEPRGEEGEEEDSELVDAGLVEDEQG